MAQGGDSKAAPVGWLLKTEPDCYSYANLERDGKTVWDGVTNHLALQNIRKVKKGDKLLIYHTGNEKVIAGLAEAASEPYPDPNGGNPKLMVFDVKPKKAARHQATLSEIKQISDMAGSALVRLPRLSVVPLDGKEWSRLTELAGI